jgi:hypothetical protein
MHFFKCIGPRALVRVMYLVSTNIYGISAVSWRSDVLPAFCRSELFSAATRDLFELCRRTQRPSLTFHPVGGSTSGLWPLFHPRDGGKWTEMTATQHGGTLKTLISSLHHYKNYACSFLLIDILLFFWFFFIFLT